MTISRVKTWSAGEVLTAADLNAEFNSIINNGIATTSAELRTIITDETGTGALVFANTPTLVTPVLGDATGTSVTLSGASSAATVAGAQVATQAQQETGTATNLIVSPGRQQYHPSALKMWVNATNAGAPAIVTSYNVASITDNGTGNNLVVNTVAFSTADCCPLATIGSNTADSSIQAITSTTAQFQVLTRTGDTPFTLSDMAFNAMAAGDQ